MLLLTKLSKKRGTSFLSLLRSVATHPFMATYKGNCIIAKMLTGKNAAQYVKLEVHLLLSNLMFTKIVALNTNMVVAIEKNKNAKPAISFLGKDLLKSHNSQGDVRIDRNMTTEANELASATTSITVNTINIG